MTFFFQSSHMKKMVVPTRNVISTKAAATCEVCVPECGAQPPHSHCICISLTLQGLPSSNYSPSSLMSLFSALSLSLLLSTPPPTPCATFIYSSQLSLHSIPPQSSTILTLLIHKKHRPLHAHKGCDSVEATTGAIRGPAGRISLAFNADTFLAVPLYIGKQPPSFTRGSTVLFAQQNRTSVSIS